MPKKTAAPPTATRAAAIPAITGVLESAPVSARLDSWAAGETSLPPGAGAAALPLAVAVVSSPGGVEAEAEAEGFPVADREVEGEGLAVCSAAQALAGAVSSGMSSLTKVLVPRVAVTWTR